MKRKTRVPALLLALLLALMTALPVFAGDDGKDKLLTLEADAFTVKAEESAQPTEPDKLSTPQIIHDRISQWFGGYIVKFVRWFKELQKHLSFKEYIDLIHRITHAPMPRK